MVTEVLPVDAEACRRWLLDVRGRQRAAAEADDDDDDVGTDELRA